MEGRSPLLMSTGGDGDVVQMGEQSELAGGSCCGRRQDGRGGRMHRDTAICAFLMVVRGSSLLPIQTVTALKPTSLRNGHFPWTPQ